MATASSSEIETILLKFEVSNVNLGNGDPFVVRVKPKTKWEKVINAFGNQFGVDPRAYKFSYDGETVKWDTGRLKVGVTLEDIDNDEAVDGVHIDVHAEQLGGASN